MAEESWALSVVSRAHWCRVGSALALVSSLLVTIRASADDGAKASTSATDVTASTSPAPPAAARAEEPGSALYDQAFKHYTQGDTSGALTLMQKAYETSGKPELLFNLGQLYRELGHCVEARKSYERYLALAQADSRRSEAADQVRELARECPEPAPPSTADAAPSAAGYWTPMRIAGWSTLGASLVFASTATYFAVHAKHLEHQVNGNIHDTEDSGYTQADKQVEDEGQHAAVVARSLAATAGGLAVVGVSFLVFGTDKRDPAKQGVSLRFGDESLTATYRGTF